MTHICELCKYSEQDFLHSHCNVCCNCDRFEFDSGRFESEIRADERKKFAKELLHSFCSYCNQEACDGGMVGSIQECTTIIMLRDVLNEIKE